MNCFSMHSINFHLATISDSTTGLQDTCKEHKKPNMKTPTKRAMDFLKNSMVQMRHDAVEEIKDGMRTCIDHCAENIHERYIVIDRQTQQSVELKGRDLMNTISDSEWYQHEILELLKQNEDDALEQVAWIAESEDAPTGCAPDERFTLNLPDQPIPTTRLPVGRDQYIQGIEELGKSSLAQDVVLRRAFEYLKQVPTVVDQETAAREAQSIAKVQHLVHNEWVREARKAQYVYGLLMRGSGRGVHDQATGALQDQIADMDIS